MIYGIDLLALRLLEKKTEFTHTEVTCDLQIMKLLKMGNRTKVIFVKDGGHVVKVGLNDSKFGITHIFELNNNLRDIAVDNTESKSLGLKGSMKTFHGMLAKIIACRPANILLDDRSTFKVILTNKRNFAVSKLTAQDTDKPCGIIIDGDNDVLLRFTDVNDQHGVVDTLFSIHNTKVSLCRMEPTTVAA